MTCNRKQIFVWSMVSAAVLCVYAVMAEQEPVDDFDRIRYSREARLKIAEVESHFWFQEYSARMEHKLQSCQVSLKSAEAIIQKLTRAVDDEIDVNLEER